MSQWKSVAATHLLVNKQRRIEPNFIKTTTLELSTRETVALTACIRNSGVATNLLVPVATMMKERDDHGNDTSAPTCVCRRGLVQRTRMMDYSLSQTKENYLSQPIIKSGAKIRSQHSI